MSKNLQSVLPHGFASLERFVDKWAKDTSQARMEVRCTSTQEQIIEFYEAVLAVSDVAMAEIAKHPLTEMPEQIQKLAKLILALAHASIAVEVHGQPRAIGAPFPNSVRVSKGAAPFG